MSADKIPCLPHPASFKGRLLAAKIRTRSFLGPARRGLRMALRGAGFRPVLGYGEDVLGDAAKRALVTYVAYPFYLGSEALGQPQHSNAQQCVEIARAFNRLGYVVDVVDWQDASFVPVRQYDVFLGMHYNFDRLRRLLDGSVVTIYYSTGAFWQFERDAEQARVDALRARRGIDLPLPVRLERNDWVETADAVVVLGNEFTALTHGSQAKHLFRIDNSSILPPAALGHKDLESARSNFLWFGSTGLLHKGLDLVLEAFREHPDLHLWVCGPLQVPDERPFVRAYARELFETDNVHPIGWVDVYSDKFRCLAGLCAFTVLATCSEGMAGGVLNCMSSGLIPLVSRESGIDTDGVGLTFADDTVAAIGDVLASAAEMPVEECRRRAEECCRQANDRYSLDSFRSSIERILRNILEVRST